MKILMSAFACDPAQGSEWGIGWTWARQLAKLGHDVCVLTRERFRASIEATLSTQDIPNLRFIYMDVRRVPYKVPIFGVYLYYFAWQLKAYLLAGQLVTLKDLDCIHHITYASCRTPFFLSWLPVPSILGPVGGGEMAPLRLTKGMSIRGKIHEYARTGANLLGSLAPISRFVWQHPALILATTEETLKLVPLKYRFKSRILPNITTPAATSDARLSRQRTGDKFRVLFVGRLLDWKGPHLAIRALSIARQAVPEISLSIIGDGHCASRLRTLVATEGLEKHVEWVPRIAREQVLEEYDKHNVLILPSLHDSGGTVVLEALSRGVPVICLKLGGPGLLVDSSCGACVDTEGRSVEELIQSIADELIRFSSMPQPEIEALRQAAYERAEQFRVGEVVGKAYSWFAEMTSVPAP